MTAAIPSTLLIHTVVWIVPSTSTDSYGDTVYTYGSGTSITGRVQQDTGTEPISDGRDPLEYRWTLFTNQEGIAGRDRIVFGSLTFEVEGPPSPQYGAAAFHHGEVAMRKVAG